MDKTTVYELLGFLIAFLGIGIAYYAIHFGIRLEKTKRELEHTERMRALELGRRLPGDEPSWSHAKIGLIIAGAVPIGVFACAMIASGAIGFQKEIWIASGMVGMAAVICGSAIVGQSPQRMLSSMEREMDKPAVEDDAYDVVAARG